MTCANKIYHTVNLSHEGALDLLELMVRRGWVVVGRENYCVRLEHVKW